MPDYSAMRPYYRFAYNIVGVELFFHRIKIEGRENVPPGGCLIVSNHVSFMDPTTVGWAVEREILARYALTKGKPAVAYRIASEHGLVTGAHFAELEFFSGWTALRGLKRLLRPR